MQQQQAQQQAQQGMMISQTNPMAMVGGQITQNVVGAGGVASAQVGQQVANNLPVVGPSGPLATQNHLGIQVWPSVKLLLYQ